MKYIYRLLLLTLTITVLACSSQKDNEDDTVVKEETFIIVEELPSFDGGMETLYNKLRSSINYPLTARQNKTDGLVEIGFVVERDGSVTGVEVVNGIGDGCDEAAITVIENITAFIPGRQRGRTVRVRMTIPFVFEINQTATNPDGTPQGIIVVKEAKINTEKFKVEAKYTDGICRGKILTSTGDPLPGANIIITGSNDGTVSGLDGSFSIEANETDELTISFVGFESYHLSMDDC